MTNFGSQGLKRSFIMRTIILSIFLSEWLILSEWCSFKNQVTSISTLDLYYWRNDLTSVLQVLVLVYRRTKYSTGLKIKLQIFHVAVFPTPASGKIVGKSSRMTAENVASLENDLPYRVDIYKLLNRTSSQIVRVASLNSGLSIYLLMLWLSKERSYCRFNCATFWYHGLSVHPNFFLFQCVFLR